MTYVEDEKWVFGAKDFWRAVGGNLDGLFVPPLVTARSPGNLLSGTRKNEDMFNKWALLERRINNCLGGDSLSSTLALICRNDHSAFAVLHTITEGFGREPSENDAVDRSDPSTCEECSDSVPCHGQVNGDGIALFNAKALEDIGDATDFPEELAVRDFFAFSWLVGFVDNCHLDEIESS